MKASTSKALKITFLAYKKFKEAFLVVNNLSKIIVTGGLIFGFIFTAAGCDFLKKTPENKTVTENKKIENKSIDTNKPAPPTNQNPISPMLQNDIKQQILGNWKLVEIIQNGKTLVKYSKPEETLIYSFSKDKFDAHLEDLQTVKATINYEWISNDTIKIIQPKTENVDKETVLKSKIRIEGGKLYMSSADAEKSKGESVLIRYSYPVPTEAKTK